MSINVQKLVEAIKATDGQGVVIFNNSLPNSRFALKSGKECIFLQGKYATGVIAEIEEIAEEINTGNPHLSLSEDTPILDKAELDPMEALRRKIIAQHEAEKQRIIAGADDYGISEQGKLNAASSADVNEAASGSISGTGASIAGSANTAKIVPGPR